MRFLLVFLLGTLPFPASGGERPNVVFLLSDDQAWNGLSTAMHPDVAGSRSDVIETPFLEQLASQGMRFSAAYAPAPVCSPTRISLLTGKSPAQLHWTKAAPPVEGRKLTEPRLIKSISNSETTFAELLKGAGYATAHFGKWHLNGGGPGKHGFDEHDGDIGNEHAAKFTDPNPVDIFGMAERADAFMQKSTRARRPFCIQLSWHALHAAGNARPATLQKYERLMPNESRERISRAAIADDLDAGVGMVLQSIDRLGLSENTFVIYMSDNGASGGRRVLRGGKGGVWEGGIRVPLIVRGPGVKPNSWCHTPVVGYDLFPTFCEWAGVPASDLPAGMEGGSIARLLADGGLGEVHRPRDELVFHFPHYQSEDGPQSAIRVGSLKLVRFFEDDHVALFDLSQDLGERHDLSRRRPEETRRLRERLDAHLSAVGAQFATVNPNFDPSLPEAPARGKRGGRKNARRKSAT